MKDDSKPPTKIELTPAQIVPIAVLQQQRENAKTRLTSLDQGLVALTTAYAQAAGLPEGKYQLQQRGDSIVLSVRPLPAETETDTPAKT